MFLKYRKFWLFLKHTSTLGHFYSNHAFTHVFCSNRASKPIRSKVRDCLHVHILGRKYVPLHGVRSIIWAVFARGVVTPDTVEMKDRDIHKQYFPNKI